jgi:hypothetical protein
MSTLEKIAFYQNRRDEIPNQLLARELVETKNITGIREIAANLENRNKNVRSDCLKVLYEIGYLDPSLIAEFVEEFLMLLKRKDNRMVWGAMIGLATIADRRADEIWPQIEEIIRITQTGTVITQVWGTRVLARVASADEVYRTRILPVLMQQLRTCLARDVPTHAESTLRAMDRQNKAEVLSILEMRRAEMTPSQRVRLNKVTKQIQAL